MDFSPRRDHGTDAAMKAARAAAIAGSAGTSNLAAAMRYGLKPVGTMAHSYVMSFEREEDAFRAFMEDFPGNAVMLVDTYDTVEGVRRAIAAARATGVPLAGRAAGLRRSAGSLAQGAGAARRGGDVRGADRGQRRPRGAADRAADRGRGADRLLRRRHRSGHQSRLAGGQRDLQARRPPRHGSGWRASQALAGEGHAPGPKQVFRDYAEGEMRGDVVTIADEAMEGRVLLTPAMRNGRSLLRDSLSDLSARAAAGLAELPAPLRAGRGSAAAPALSRHRVAGARRAGGARWRRRGRAGDRAGLAQHGRT